MDLIDSSAVALFFKSKYWFKISMSFFCPLQKTYILLPKKQKIQKTCPRYKHLLYIHQFIRQRQKHSFSYQLQYIDLSVPLSWVTWYWVGVSFFLKSSLLKLFGQTFCFPLAPVGGSTQKKFKIGCADTGCWYQVTILLQGMSTLLVRAKTC